MKARSSQRDIHTVTSLTQRVGTGVISSSHWLASQRRFLSLMKAVRLVGGISDTRAWGDTGGGRPHRRPGHYPRIPRRA